MVRLMTNVAELTLFSLARGTSAHDPIIVFHRRSFTLVSIFHHAAPETESDAPASRRRHLRAVWVRRRCSNRTDNR